MNRAPGIGVVAALIAASGASTSSSAYAAPSTYDEAFAKTFAEPKPGETVPETYC